MTVDKVFLLLLFLCLVVNAAVQLFLFFCLKRLFFDFKCSVAAMELGGEYVPGRVISLVDDPDGKADGVCLGGAGKDGDVCGNG